MYRIIGGDQREYGPVSADQLREWILAGRADARTRVLVEGAAEWQELGALPEFADTLVARGAAPLTSPVGVPKTSGMAVASLVLGVLGMCGLTALAGLILGIVSLRKINRSQGQLGGQGLAIAGIAVSAFMLLFSIPVVAGITLPALAKAKAEAQSVQCMNNVRQLGLAAIIYANDHEGRLPDAGKWCDLLQKKLGSSDVLRCPAGNRAERCHYAFNLLMSGTELNRIENAARTVLFIESPAGWNRSAGPELLTGPSRHQNHIAVCFADGHVEMVTSARRDELRWAP